jgi:NDP-sugar pyrophosphorylase family protein
MKAMIFAAGLGTRLKPLTNSRPKALIEINGKTLLEIIIKKLARSGFSDIVINVHHFAEQIVDFLDSKNNFGLHIIVSDERNLLLDTGGGLKKASSFFDDNKPFLVHNADVLSNIDILALYNSHLENKSLATLACQERDSTRQFLVDAANELAGWKNNVTGEVRISRQPSEILKPLSFCGIQVISPQLLDLISENGVFSIIDLYLRLAKNHIIKILTFNEAAWIDIGTPENLKKARTLFKE